MPPAPRWSHEFGERAREYSVLDRTRATRKFAVVGLCQLELAERLGAAGKCFRDWVVADLTAYARHAYDAPSNLFHALLRDGTRLSPADVKRPGYYRPETFQPFAGSPLFFWAYSRAYRMSGDALFGETAASLARGLGLGDIPHGAPSVPHTANDLRMIQALLEWNRLRPSHELLAAAKAAAENLLRDRFVAGLFVERPRQRFARLGGRDPLALLHLAATLKGLPPDSIPPQLPGEKYFTAHWWQKGRTSDYIEWFPQERT